MQDKSVSFQGTRRIQGDTGGSPHAAVRYTKARESMYSQWLQASQKSLYYQCSGYSHFAALLGSPLKDDHHMKASGTRPGHPQRAKV